MFRVRRTAKSPAAPTNTSLRQQAPSLQTLSLEEVSRQKVFATAFLAGFDLPQDLSVPFRVYVLRCEQSGFLDLYCYYVGLVPEEDLHERMEKHFAQDVVTSKFTAVNKPLGVELLWPAAHRAAEGYLFLYVLNKFHYEDDVLKHVRLGGFVQTATKPLSAENYNSLQRQFRMVKTLCLDCGLSSHKAGADECEFSKRRRRIPEAPLLPLSVSAPSPAAVSPPEITATPPVVRAASTDCGFEAWFEKRRPVPLQADEEGWIPLKNALLALGESPQNPARFVTADSDSPAKLWKLGRKVPKFNTDWKRASPAARAPWFVRKEFLKRVILERYPSKLRPRGCRHH